MYLHIARSRSRPFLFLHYRLHARLEATATERAAIREHRLDRFEIFADPYRDYLLARADKARERQKAMPWIMDSPQQLGGLWLEIGREMTLLVRARWSFRITLGDLLRGVSISNPSLNAIRETERVLAESVDAIAATVRAALDYEHAGELVLAPAADDLGTPPDQWGSTW